MGTYSADRQPGLERLLFEPARALPDRHFQVAGAQYPKAIVWPANVAHREHLAPAIHAQFYCKQRFTLNLTREDMRAAGHSPSVRLFEAAACATPIISDNWPGLDELFANGREILIAETAADVCRHLTQIGDAERIAMGRAAQERVLELHTGTHRAAELEGHLSLVRHDKVAVTARAV
jgi:spore maturation protein CgeB